MGFTDCPPPKQASAAGYVATDPLHPAVVVMAWPETGWLASDSLDPVHYHDTESLQVDDTWLAADVSGLHLIICVDAAHTQIQKCQYTGGGSITRWRGDVAVVAYDARTGGEVDRRVIEGEGPNQCPDEWTPTAGVNIAGWVGDPPGVAEVEAAIEYFVTTAHVLFSDGTHRIGVNLEPGTYRTVDYTDGCHWARLRGLPANPGSTISEAVYASGYQVVTISPQDVAFESDNCGEWTNDLTPVGDFETSFKEGTYVVGTDIQPGTYSSAGGSRCYWARLSGFGGTLPEIIDNSYGASSPIVAIRASDKGFDSSRCGTWTRH